ncbi:MAG: PAS domain-containing protein [Blastocatellia bacterium]
MRLLIADDNPADQRDITALLRAHFPAAEIMAISDLAGFEAALSRSPDAVITEYRLDWTDGLWLTRMVREQMPCVPVIMVTRSGSEEVAVAGMKAGLSDYVLKKNLSDLPDALEQSLAQAQQQQESREQLHQAEIRFRSLVEQIPAVTYLTDPFEDGRMRYVSPQAETIFGYAPPEWMADPDLWPGLIHPDDKARVIAELSRCRQEQIPFICEYRLMARDGQVVWVRDHAVLLCNQEGQPVSLLGVALNITEHRQTEAERRRLYEEVCVARDRLRLLSQQLIAAQENERRYIARELHDQFGQALTALKINLQTCQRRSLPPELAEQIEDSIRLVDASLQQVRDLSLELRPSLLDDLGLVSALRWYLDRLAQRAGLAAEFIAADLPGRLPTEIETTCFRIAQEALTNIIRHAGARCVRVELQHLNDQLRLMISDDGRGFDVAATLHRAASGGSLGLSGMQERARFTGGQFEIDSTAGRGTRVRATFPLSGI